jgi:uncharacterized membrane protein YbhN (UPF0104 family)
MSRTTQAAALIGVGVICVALGIYYLIPGIYHPFTFSPPNESHHTHAIALFVVAVVAILGSRFVLNSRRQ